LVRLSIRTYYWLVWLVYGV